MPPPQHQQPQQQQQPLQQQWHQQQQLAYPQPQPQPHPQQQHQQYPAYAHPPQQQQQQQQPHLHQQQQQQPIYSNAYQQQPQQPPPPPPQQQMQQQQWAPAHPQPPQQQQAYQQQPPPPQQQQYAAPLPPAPGANGGGHRAAPAAGAAAFNGALPAGPAPAADGAPPIVQHLNSGGGIPPSRAMSRAGSPARAASPSGRGSYSAGPLPPAAAAAQHIAAPASAFAPEQQPQWQQQQQQPAAAPWDAQQQQQQQQAPSWRDHYPAPDAAAPWDGFDAAAAAATMSAVPGALQPASALASAATTAAAQHAAAGAPPPPPPDAPAPLLTAPPPDVCVVDTAEKARAVVQRLLEVARDGVLNPATGAREPAFFACDTEVAAIDIKEQSPVGHGVVTCFSIYAGPWTDFSGCGGEGGGANGGGGGGGGQPQPRIWVDLLKGWERKQRARLAAERAARREAELRQAAEDAAAAAAAAEAEAAAAAAAAALDGGEEAPKPRRRTRRTSKAATAAATPRAASPEEEQAGAADGGAKVLLGDGSAAIGEALRAKRGRKKATTTAAAAAEAPSSSSSSSPDGGGSGGVVAAAALVIDDGWPEAAAAAAAAAAPAHASLDTAAGAAAGAAFAPLLEEELPPPTLAEICDEDAEAKGILDAFRAFFEADATPCGAPLRKVWHNYGFDRHVLANMGVRCGGFAGDTLHMARLHDASRKLAGGYSLEALSGDRQLLDVLEAELKADALQPKRGMKERFALARVKRDGTLTKARFVAPVHALHTQDATRYEWVDYSALDAKATWNVHRALSKHLAGNYAYVDPLLAEQLRLRLGPAPSGGGGGNGNGGNGNGAPAAAQSKPGRLPGPKRSPRGAPPPVAAAAALAPAPDASSSSPDSSNGSADSSSGTAVDGGSTDGGGGGYTLLGVYDDYWRPFGELLTSMEAAGVKVNRAHLREQEAQARSDQAAAEAFFREWAASKVPAARHMNISSGLQIRQLLFPDAEAGGVRAFKADNPDYDRLIAEGAKPKPLRFIDMELHGVWGRGAPGRLSVEVTTDKGAPAVSTAVLRALAGKPGAALKALKEMDDTIAVPSLEPIFDLDFDDFGDDGAGVDGGGGAEGGFAGGDDLGGLDGGAAGDSAGGPQRRRSRRSRAASGGADSQQQQQQQQPEPPRSQEELEAEAAARGYGRMYAAMGGGREGLWACAALEKLCEVSAIDKLLSAFIVPLQSDDISTPADHRVHCSLNLNTETGRLSARRPNLQNQPALEKDRYKVRRAFTADVAAGKTLIVADYGQLELRLLAHMTKCASMITAFELGGDFHSR